MNMLMAMALSETFADSVRYLYAILAGVACAGFVATLLIRWDVLQRGEKILRSFLVLEHAVITYAGYVALDADYPPSIVGTLLTVSLMGIIFGFAVWIGDMIAGSSTGIKRLIL